MNVKQVYQKLSLGDETHKLGKVCSVFPDFTTEMFVEAMKSVYERYYTPNNEVVKMKKRVKFF